MKKIFSKVCFLFLFFFLFSIPAQAQVKTFVIEGKNYVTALDVAKAFNMELEWDDTMRVLSMHSPRLNIKFLSDQKYFLVNSDIYSLQDNVVLYNGGFFIPLEFMGEIKNKIMSVSVSTALDVPAYLKSDSIKKIIIDPGHGGEDAGAIGHTGLKEKDVVLAVALHLRDLLRSVGYQVVMTRETDVFIPLWMRSKIANKSDADLFVSIHANSARASDANGIEVFYLSDAMDDYSRSVEAVENSVMRFEDPSSSQFSYDYKSTKAAIWDLTCDEYRKESSMLARHVLNNMGDTVGFSKRGVKCARFFVLKKTFLPSILVEIGFISNREEEWQLSDKTVRNSIANSIFKGIQMYAREIDRIKNK